MVDRGRTDGEIRSMLVDRFGEDIDYMPSGDGLVGLVWVLPVIVGGVALACGGYFLILHLMSGPRIFHFEIVGLITGVLLLWERLNLARRTGRDLPASGSSGAGLILAIFGVIATLVGLQGLFTQN